jgi:hypothetical protein
VPVFILHGSKDRLIPYRQSEMLRQLAPERVVLFPIVGAGHNNLPEFPAYHDLLYDILHNELCNADFADKKSGFTRI